MDSFNLNSDSYTDTEIEDLFNLKPSYNMQDVSFAKSVLTRQLNTTKGLGVEKQREIMFFIDTIANRVINKVITMNQVISINQANNLPQDNTIITQGTNFIIEKPDILAGKQSDFTNGRITHDASPAPPGYINPINVRTINQAISFDSRFRPNYYNTKSTNFDIVLPAIQKNVISVRVANIELPLTYYAVSQSQGNVTCLIINLDPANANQCWILTLPDGNYEQGWADRSKAESIEIAMNSAISAAQPALIDENGVVTILSPSPPNIVLYLTPEDLTYSLDRISGRSIFSTPAVFPTPLTPPLAPSIFQHGFTVRFNVDKTGSLNMDTSIQLRLGWQLGFRSAEYVCEAIPTKTNSLCISEGICLITGPRYAFLSIDDHQKNTGPAYIVAYGNSILQNNIITRINLAALQAEVGIYKSSSDPGLTSQVNRTREYFGPVDIQRLHISLYDEFGRIIDLNNMDWSFSLSFEILYN
jgi:hypothetical protein